MGDIGKFKVHFMGYFGTQWMTLNEELQCQMCVRLYFVFVCMYLYSAQYLHILQDSKRYLTCV